MAIRPRAAPAELRRREGKFLTYERTLVLLNRLSWSVVLLVLGVLVLAVISIVQISRLVDSAQTALTTVTAHIRPELLDAAIADGLGTVHNAFATSESVAGAGLQVETSITNVALAISQTSALLNEFNGLMQHPVVTLALGAAGGAGTAATE